MKADLHVHSTYSDGSDHVEMVLAQAKQRGVTQISFVDHIDSVEATGFISHLKLPHYVTFQSKLDSVP